MEDFWMIRTCFSTDEQGLDTEGVEGQHGVIEGWEVGRACVSAMGWDRRMGMMREDGL